MAIVIPKLPDEFIVFGVCAMVDAPTTGLIRWVKGHPFKPSVAKYKVGRANRWIEAQYDIPRDGKGVVHVHVDLYADGPEDTSAVKADVEQIEKHIAGFVEEASGARGFVVSRARVSVPRQEIPQGGMISRLFDSKTRSRGVDFLLTGVKLSTDDEFFDRMSVNYDYETKKIVAELWASAPVIIDDDYLSKFLDLMATGVDNFIFEGMPREIPNA